MARHETERAERGRHRRRRVHRTWLTVAVPTSVLALTGSIAIGVPVLHRHGAVAKCRPPIRSLRVAAAPEIASFVAHIAEEHTDADHCPTVNVKVSAMAPARASALIRARSVPIDVWIPDSSMWAATAPYAGSASYTSIARSPIVVAVSTIAGGRHSPAPTFRSLAESVLTAHPTHWAAVDPGSTAQVGVVLALRAAATDDPATRGTVTAVLRSMASTSGASGIKPPASPPASDAVAIATTEQEVWRLNSGGHSTRTAVYPPPPGFSVDYPYVVLAADASTRADSANLLTALVSASARTRLQGEGFRAPDGSGGPELTAALGVDRTAPATGPVPSQAQAQAATDALAVLRRPSRLLAVIDVSGSMATQVPSRDHSSRLDVARAAAANALGLFGADSVVGLWEFSADLTPATDYRELAPLAPFATPTRAKLAAALNQLAVNPNGGTGLYDTVLAAVRAVRAGYDASRVNTVVILSDGKDEDDHDHGITLSALLRILRAENDPTRPVPVITIAYGPSSDQAAMRTISTATGGSFYLSSDPTNLPQIFLDAIGQRLCRPRC
jgi:Ca-activated chloride channel family protein